MAARTENLDALETRFGNLPEQFWRQLF